jgi:large subunit ribosomal protein L15
VKLHELHPAPGSRRERTRVGRGIAAGKGKTAGRGTKGQRSRTGSSIPAWFEGGQTPIHIRVPKLRGFKNRFRVAYAVVNLGRIEAALEGGRLELGPKKAPATVNLELLFTAGLVGRLDRPLKILGGGELTHPILAVADAFSADARRKIEAAGGTAMVLEVPGSESSGAGSGADALPAGSALLRRAPRRPDASPASGLPAPEVSTAPEESAPPEAAATAEPTETAAEPTEMAAAPPVTRRAKRTSSAQASDGEAAGAKRPSRGAAEPVDAVGLADGSPPAPAPRRARTSKKTA